MKGNNRSKTFSKKIQLNQFRNRKNKPWNFNPRSDLDNDGNPRIPIHLRLNNGPNRVMKTKDRVDLKIRLRRQTQNKANPQQSNVGYTSQKICNAAPQFRRSVDRNEPKQTKVIIGNLNHSVTVDDIQELCSSIGSDVRVTALHPGTILVSFDKKSDAHKAIKKFNGRKLDGQNMCMNIIN